MKKFYTWDLRKWVEINPLDFGQGVYTLKVVEDENEQLPSGGPRGQRESKTRFPVVLRLVARDGRNS